MLLTNKYIFIGFHANGTSFSSKYISHSSWKTESIKIMSGIMNNGIIYWVGK
jgi:hypothetical protein